MDAKTSLENCVIKDFKKVFWCAEANRKDDVFWTKFPVSRRGTGYSRLMQNKKGMAAFCVFIAMVRLCARNKTLGRLTLKGKPISHQDLATESGISTKVIAESIEYLKSEEIGWILPASEAGESLSEVDSESDSESTSDRSPLTRGRTRPSVSASESESSDSEANANKPHATRPETGPEPTSLPFPGVPAQSDPPAASKPKVRLPSLAEMVWHYVTWKKKGEDVALREIARAIDRVALKKFDGDKNAACEYLCQAAREYSDSAYVKTCPKQFRTPPSVWFRDGNYSDDRSLWAEPRQDFSQRPGSAPAPKPRSRAAAGAH